MERRKITNDEKQLTVIKDKKEIAGYQGGLNSLFRQETKESDYELSEKRRKKQT